MEKAIFTTLCMVCDKNNRVLVQERKSTSWNGIAFPGGHVEIGESFVESVIREVYEETGYHIKTPILCGIKQFQTVSNARYIILLYKANKFDGTLRSSSEGEVFWVNRNDLNNYQLANDMEAMLELFDNPEKSEFYYYNDKDAEAYKIL